MKISKDSRFLFILFPLALVIRLIGIDFCLPFKYSCVDETSAVFFSFRMLTGQLDPDPFYFYPALHLYLMALLFLAFFPVLYAAGNVDGYRAYISLFWKETERFLLLARMFSVFFDLLSIFVFYKIVINIFKDEKKVLAYVLTGMFALSPRNILLAHYGTLDSSALFFLLLSFYLIVLYKDKPGFRSIAFMAVSCAASAAIKYYGVIMLFLVFYSFFIQRRKFSDYLHFMLVFIIFFFIFTPFNLLSFKKVLLYGIMEQFRGIVLPDPSNYSLIKSGYTMYIVNIVSDLGVFISGLSCAGLYYLLKKQPEKKFILVFPAAYYILTGFWKAFPERFTLPLYPFVIIISGLCLSELGKKMTNRKAYRALIAVAFIPLFLRSYEFLSIVAGRDTREIAREWALKNLPRGSKILRLPYTPEFSEEDGFNVFVDWEYKEAGRDIKYLKNNYNCIIIGCVGETTKKIEERFDRDLALPVEFKGRELACFHNPRVKIYYIKKEGGK